MAQPQTESTCGLGQDFQGVEFGTLVSRILTQDFDAIILGWNLSLPDDPESQTFFRAAPHRVVLPGLLIVIPVLCLYVIGDGIRDALDPTLKNE